MLAHSLVCYRLAMTAALFAGGGGSLDSEPDLEVRLVSEKYDPYASLLYLYHVLYDRGRQRPSRAMRSLIAIRICSITPGSNT